MTVFLAISWGIFGWCGNEPKPVPNPRRDLAAVIGGILGGLLVQTILGSPEGAMGFIAMAMGAFATGRVLSDIAGRFGK
jgi:hypothetical protein